MLNTAVFLDSFNVINALRQKYTLYLIYYLAVSPLLAVSACRCFALHRGI